MASVVDEGLFSVKVTTEESSSSSTPTNAVIFVGISLVLGIACRHLLRGTRVPYTVALLILGIGLGSIEYGTSHGLGKIGDGIRIWANIDPNLLLAVFLPAFLFESSFSMEVHQIKKCMAQMIMLAGPGVLISTFCLGSALKLTFPYDWSWKTSLLLGGLLSATDPVAVVALLKELGASKKLNTIIEGESLMNDGTAIVVYQLFYRMVLGESFSFGAIVLFLTEVALGAVGIGLAFGIASVLWLGFIFNDTVIEIALTLTVSYIAFFTAQEGADVSGVLAVMTLGMFFAAVARTAFKGDGQQSLHHFWEMVSYIANTLIFILSAIMLGKLLLPQIFEKMAMQELRVLVAERSIMTIHIRGESIEIAHHSIGLLLEGFVKTQGAHEELIISPAALLPSHGDQSFQGSETLGFKQVSFSHQGSLYQVETRARVIIFDIDAFESTKALQRRTSSFVPRHPGDHPTRSQSKEHVGLMSWPEHFYKPVQADQNADEIDQQESSLSARAMQLSIYGSMVNIHQARAPSTLGSNPARQSHSLSYPRVPSSRERVLVSVRSEGSSLVRKNGELVQKLKGQDLTPEVESSSNTKESHVMSDSSDESGAEDELIVRIDSPSRLSFRQP